MRLRNQCNSSKFIHAPILTAITKTLVSLSNYPGYPFHYMYYMLIF